MNSPLPSSVSTASHLHAWRLNYKVVLLVAAGLVIVLAAAYLIIFGSALRQKNNHLKIALAIPRSIFGHGVARIDGKSFLARTPEAFAKEAARDGFKLVEQMGNAFLFDKDGIYYSSTAQAYSRFFLIYSDPAQGVLLFRGQPAS